MNLDTCLILAAGFGTRMGEIGKYLPKVLWPIFEKSLLELQVLQLRSLGFRHIYINLHHQRDLILKYTSRLDSFNDVEFLIEEDILDIGGGIHNLASKIGYSKSIYIVNSDQFIFLDKELLKPCSVKANLFLIEENSIHLYNQVATDVNGRMKEIVPNAQLPRNERIFTYSGNSIVNLSLLQKSSGKTNFFDSVATYKTSEVQTTILNKSEYWDFGTKKLYWDNLFKLLNDNKSTMKQFLKSEKAFLDKKLRDSSYDSSLDSVINLSGHKFTRGGSPSIILKSSSTEPASRAIIYEDIVDLIY